MRCNARVVVVFLCACAATASAQDLGTQWMDRVSNDLRTERGPNPAAQVDWSAAAGLLAFYDTNVFLTENDEKGDTVWMPFLQGRLEDNGPQRVLVADLLVNYKHYVEEEDARDTEVRFLGKVGFSGASLSASLTQLIRHESDPTDAVFADRTERLVSDTIPSLAIDVTDVLVIEVNGHVMGVRFDETVIADQRDNISYRGDIGLVYRDIENLDLVAQVGFLAIQYTDHEDPLGNPTAPPDVDGIYARIGARGEVTPTLFIEALVGYIKVESEDYDFLVPVEGEEDSTMDVTSWVRFNASDSFTASGGYTRTISFAGGQDPYQLINRFQAVGELEATEEVSIKVRFMYDLVDSALGVERTYLSVGGMVTYRPMENLQISGGATHRVGEIEVDDFNDTDYSGTVYQLGVAVLF